MRYKYLIFIAMAVLLIAPVMAKELSIGDVNELVLKPDLKDLEAKQVLISDRLDGSYIIKESGVYFKDLKQIDPFVWIDKKVGDTYHVDSKRDFIENETVTLEFFYNIQPDNIAHFTHSGKFDRYYFPTQWDWRANCSGEGEEEICQGGWVTINVSNIEEGYGSSTFPIGITGPQWARQGQGYGEFDGDTSSVDGNSSKQTINTTFVFWAKATNGDNDRFAKLGSNYYYYNDGGRITYNFYNGTGYNSMILLASSEDQEWKQIIVNAYNKSGNMTAELYINGVLNNSIDSTYGTVIENYNLDIGQSDGINFWEGYIDEVLVYNRSLSSAEITLLYANYSLTDAGVVRSGTPSTEGLIIDINFDDFSVEDNSGSGNHGTPTNVSFSVVQEVYKSLTGTTDFTVSSGGLLTILNNDFLASFIIVSWVYDTGLSLDGTFNVDTLKDAFSLFVTSLLGFLSVIGVLLAIVWMIGYLKPLFSRKEGIQNFEAN